MILAVISFSLVQEYFNTGHLFLAIVFIFFFHSKVNLPEKKEKYING